MKRCRKLLNLHPITVKESPLPKARYSQLKAQISLPVEKTPAFAGSQQATKFDAIKWIDQILLLGIKPLEKFLARSSVSSRD
jgi:hypothetical protein